MFGSGRKGKEAKEKKENERNKIRKRTTFIMAIGNSMKIKEINQMAFNLSLCFCEEYKSV